MVMILGEKMSGKGGRGDALRGVPQKCRGAEHRLVQGQGTDAGGSIPLLNFKLHH